MGAAPRALKRLMALVLTAAILCTAAQNGQAKTQKPPLHGRHWMAITGKPLAATAGAMIFQKGGNAVDAACAMIAATSTMWDTLSWGGETQALIYNPNTGKVIGINALGVAPTGATPEFFHKQGMRSRRPHDHVGRVRHAESRGSARARHRDGGWLSDGGRVVQHDRQIQGQDRA